MSIFSPFFSPKIFQGKLGQLATLGEGRPHIGLDCRIFSIFYKHFNFLYKILNLDLALSNTVR